MPEASSPSPAIYETRQQVEDFVIDQVPLGANASVQSNTLESAGYNAVRILIRTNALAVGTIEVYQSPTDPNGVFDLTDSKPTAVDPATGEQVAFFSSTIFGGYTRIVYVNGGVPQTVFQMSAYLIPVGG